MRKRLILLLLSLLLTAIAAASPLQAQVTWQVFRAPAADGSERVTFVNLYTGETTEATVSGARYTPAGHFVLFYDTANNRVAQIFPDGAVEPHPFIQPGPQTRRVDWMISGNQQYIAWTLTEGPLNSLITTTTVANIDGTNARQVLVDGPRNGIRAMPVAFSADAASLYMDYQPDGLDAFTPYTEYAGLFEVNLKDGGIAGYLPNEPGCFCGAGFGGGYFLRMALADDLSGFDLRVVNIAAQVERTLPALNATGYTQGGDVLVSDDGQRAVYALAQVQNFGAENQSLRTLFVLADLESGTQRELTTPVQTYVRPVAWTEGNTAVLFTSPTRPGTWKITLEAGRLARIADETYIGTLSE